MNSGLAAVVIAMGMGAVFLLMALRVEFSGLPAAGDAYLYRVSRSKGKVTAVSIGLNLPDTLRFVLRDEWPPDRIAKWLGLAREWQTDDPEFDRCVYILSEDRELLDALSRDVTLRGQVQRVLRVPGVPALYCSGGKLWVAGKIGSPDSELSDPRIAQAAAELVAPTLREIRDRLMQEHAPLWTNERDPGMRRRAFLQAVCALLGMAGAACGLWSNGWGLPRPLVHEAIYQHALFVAMGAAGLLLVALAVLLGRASRTHIVLAQILCIAAPGVWLLAATRYELRNEQLDNAPAQIVHAHVQNLYVTHGRHSTYYHLVVSGWPDARFDPSMEVDSHIWHQLQVGGCVDLTVYPGKLGDPWLADIEASGVC